MSSSLSHYGKPFSIAVIVSAACHLSFFLAVMYGNLLPSKTITYTPAYTVRLVTEPGPEQPPAGQARATAKAGTAPVQAPKPATRMILPIEKKAQAPSRQAIMSAIKRINSEIRNEQLLNAIKQATEKTGKEGKAGAAAPPGAPGKAGGGAPGSGAAAPSGGVAEQYYALLWEKIHDAWLVPSSMAASSYGYETVVSITIERDGTVTDVGIEKGSGNVYFDQTALRAIKRASPLPPFPPGWLQKSISIGIKFSCKEGCE